MKRCQQLLCLFVASILLSVYNFAEGDSYCPKSDQQVPPGFNFSRVNEYNFADGTLQIFSSIRMPCDGWVTEYRFFTRTATIEGLIIGIFRQRLFEPIFDLVGETLIDKMATPKDMVNIWVQYRLPSPIAVRTGDVLGIFYSDVLAEATTLSIPSREDPSQLMTVDQLPSYILFLDGVQLHKTKAVDVTNAIQTNRQPALIAVVSGYLPLDVNVKPPSWKLASEQLPKAFYQRSPKHYVEQVVYDDSQQPSSISTRCFMLPKKNENFCWAPRWRYYFEIETSTCRQFYGCRSSEPMANNFDSRAECRYFCKEVTTALPDHYFHYGHVHHNHPMPYSNQPTYATAPVQHDSSYASSLYVNPPKKFVSQNQNQLRSGRLSNGGGYYGPQPMSPNWQQQVIRPPAPMMYPSNYVNEYYNSRGSAYWSVGK